MYLLELILHLTNVVTTVFSSPCLRRNLQQTEDCKIKPSHPYKLSKLNIYSSSPIIAQLHLVDSLVQ